MVAASHDTGHTNHYDSAVTNLPSDSRADVRSLTIIKLYDPPAVNRAAHIRDFLDKITLPIVDSVAHEKLKVPITEHDIRTAI
ncbi:hypothetical protein NDU88_008737 [Pleurodeles waltl]|uniref:Uncharacterized protein n=1 Tax=Pleurodeles waltl TaxID=8319 RepID=A0AAV7RTZ1_PLEWA|nr:hypothetical protein NDU88_008737 [Pleurodeles waltl]